LTLLPAGYIVSETNQEITVPFSSKAQARYLFANHPDIAMEWADKTKSFKKLPDRLHPHKEKSKEKDKMNKTALEQAIEWRMEKMAVLDPFTGRTERGIYEFGSHYPPHLSKLEEMAKIDRLAGRAGDPHSAAQLLVDHNKWKTQQAMMSGKSNVLKAAKPAAFNWASLLRK
jgi:hypothetical protein